jgi:hypothetical protein
MVDLVLQYAPEVIGAVFATLVIIVGKTTADHVWLASMLGRLIVEAKAAVLEVEQVYVDKLKEGRADGVLMDAEKKEARALALATLRSNIGIKGLRRLGRILGLTDEEINRLLGTRIEASVKENT